MELRGRRSSNICVRFRDSRLGFSLTRTAVFLYLFFLCLQAVRARFGCSSPRASATSQTCPDRRRSRAWMKVRSMIVSFFLVQTPPAQLGLFTLCLTCNWCCIADRMSFVFVAFARGWSRPPMRHVVFLIVACSQGARRRLRQNRHRRWVCRFVHFFYAMCHISADLPFRLFVAWWSHCFGGLRTQRISVLCFFVRNCTQWDLSPLCACLFAARPGPGAAGAAGAGAGGPNDPIYANAVAVSLSADGLVA